MRCQRPGVVFELEGDANDYIGKAESWGEALARPVLSSCLNQFCTVQGLSGGRIIVFPPKA